MSKSEDTLKEIESLQEKIKNCKDDRQAVELQRKMVNILLKTFKNQDLIKTVLEDRQKKK